MEHSDLATLYFGVGDSPFGPWCIAWDNLGLVYSNMMLGDQERHIRELKKTGVAFKWDEPPKKEFKEMKTHPGEVCQIPAYKKTAHGDVLQRCQDQRTQVRAHTEEGRQQVQHQLC